MKKSIHPKYDVCAVKCVCGNAFQTRATISNIDVEVCGACHPVYTGKKKIVDSTGRVDRYNKILSQKASKKKSKKEVKSEKPQKSADQKALKKEKKPKKKNEK